ncbi:MAG: hypothetical protein OXH15_11260 [Gammaproteobacteria bacterium]|nr:hypothetical protein [Gammaproteobacteria bacterium]
MVLVVGSWRLRHDEPVTDMPLRTVDWPYDEQARAVHVHWPAKFAQRPSAYFGASVEAFDIPLALGKTQTGGLCLSHVVERIEPCYARLLSCVPETERVVRNAAELRRALDVNHLTHANYECFYNQPPVQQFVIARLESPYTTVARVLLGAAFTGFAPVYGSDVLVEQYDWGCLAAPPDGTHAVDVIRYGVGDLNESLAGPANLTVHRCWAEGGLFQCRPLEGGIGVANDRHEIRVVSTLREAHTSGNLFKLAIADAHDRRSDLVLRHTKTRGPVATDSVRGDLQDLVHGVREVLRDVGCCSCQPRTDQWREVVPILID